MPGDGSILKLAITLLMLSDSRAPESWPEMDTKKDKKEERRKGIENKINGRQNRKTNSVRDE